MRLHQIALLGASSLLFFSGCLATAFAQDSGPIETVVVTGTRIPRPEGEAPNPIISLTAEDIKQSGTTNLGDYLKRIPALSGSLGDFETSGYNTSTSDDGSSLSGLNLLDLRNLGYVRTLVLIDGRRTIGQSTGSSAVDIDSIPITLISRVDVSTGGSSAVYGADGVSGVVNFIMQHDLEGVTARTQYGSSQDGGGAKSFAAVSVGHNFDDGKGNVTLTYEASRQDDLYFTQRSFTDVGGISYFVPNPANYFGTIANLPANIPTKNARFLYSAPTGALDTNLDGFPDMLGNGKQFNIGTCVDPDCATGTTIGGSGMPYAQDLQGGFQPVENRRIARAGADYEFASWFKLSGEFNYAHVDTRSAETAPFDDDVMISQDNAFLPANVAASIAANGSAPFTSNGLNEAALSEDYLQMRNSEYVQRDTYRFVLDAKGDIPSSGFFSNTKYDVSYVYGQTDIADTLLNNRITDRFMAALDSVVDPATGQATCRSNLNPSAVPPDLEYYYGDPTATYFSDTTDQFMVSQFGTTFTPGPNSGCVPFNPFNPNDPNNKASIAWMTKNTTTTGFLSQQVFNGNVSGDVPSFKDWGFAGPASFVLGFEWRQEESKSQPDPQTEIPGLYWEGGTDPVRGRYSVSEGFAEANLPVLADKPFAEELTLHAAGRVSHYSSAGDNQSWEFDGIYVPVEGLKFRGTDSVAVRAPDIGELFAPTQQLFQGIADPCDAANINDGTSFRKANCQTVENALFGNTTSYTAGSSSVETDQETLTYVSGNSALKPETARTQTLGAVIQPGFLPGFTATVDWYRVSIADAIESPTAQAVANECVDLSTVNNLYCGEIVRTANGRFPGSIKQVSTGQINVATYLTKGEDFTIDYLAQTQDWFGQDYGSLNFHLIGNHTDLVSTTPLPGQAPIESQNTVCGGVDCTPTPYWQFNLDLLWHWDAFTLDYNVEWYDGVLQTDRQTVESEPNYVAKKYLHLDPKNDHSIQVGYDVQPGWNLYLGVDNLWYQKPSIGQSGYPEDPLGRFFYGGVKVDTDFAGLGL